MKPLGGKLSGRVMDVEGRPIKGARVYGYLDGPQLAVRQTDEDGAFSFASVDQGAHYVKAKAAGYMVEGSQAQVTAGGTATTGFVLRRGDRVLTGRVIDECGKAPLEAEVYLYRNGLVITETKSGPREGAFVFPDLVEGDYEVSAHAVCHEPGSWAGHLSGREDVPLVLLPVEGCTHMARCDVCEGRKEVRYCGFCHAYICDGCRHNYPERIRAMLRRRFKQSGLGPSEEEIEAEVKQLLADSKGCKGCP